MAVGTGGLALGLNALDSLLVVFVLVGVLGLGEHGRGQRADLRALVREPALVALERGLGGGVVAVAVVPRVLEALPYWYA